MRIDVGCETMKRNDSILVYTLKGAVILAVCVPIGPALQGHHDLKQVALSAILGFTVGIIVWPLDWLREQRFRRKEREAIEQMHAEATSESAPSADSEASDA